MAGPHRRRVGRFSAAPTGVGVGARVGGDVPAPRGSDRGAPARAGRDRGAGAGAADGDGVFEPGAVPGTVAPPAGGAVGGGGGAARELMRAQDEFVAARKSDWGELQGLLDSARALHKLPAPSIARAAALYRSVCGDLMRAQAAGYGPEVLGLLDALAGRAHNALYSAPPYRLRAVGELLATDFPRTLRRHGRLFALAIALFLLPGLVGFFGARRSRAFALQILPPAAAEQMEKSYSEGFNKGRSGSVDATMAGFYVYNNIGIAFRCFATGVLFGLGSAFFLLYNWLFIGTVGGLVTAAGHGRNLLTFTCTHGAFELTAIVISATAGVVLG